MASAPAPLPMLENPKALCSCNGQTGKGQDRRDFSRPRVNPKIQCSRTLSTLEGGDGKTISRFSHVHQHVGKIWQGLMRLLYFFHCHCTGEDPWGGYKANNPNNGWSADGWKADGWKADGWSAGWSEKAPEAPRPKAAPRANGSANGRRGECWGLGEFAPTKRSLSLIFRCHFKRLC